MKTGVDVRELSDGVLLRLFLISSYMAQDQWLDEETDWQRIGAVTGREIQQRGFSPDCVAGMAHADAENLVTILLAFQQEQARERRQRVQ
jgi:hypothetical protein